MKLMKWNSDFNNQCCPSK